MTPAPKATLSTINPKRNALGSNPSDIILLRLVFIHKYIYGTGYAVAQLVEALRYKPEGRGFDS